MKCPKCGYLGFERVERCRNCGYDFSLTTPGSTVPDLAIRAAGIANMDPLADLALVDQVHLRDLPAPGADASADLVRKPVEDRGRGHVRDLPLFGSAADDVPLITRASPPRTPLAVRRATPDLPRLRAEPRATMLDLHPPPVDPTPRRVSPTPPVVGTEPERRPVRSAEVETAATWARVLAATIDLALLFAIDTAVVYFTLQICDLTLRDVAMLPRIPMVAFLVVQNLAYFVAFTAGGQTLGQMLMGIKVVSTDDEGSPHLRQAVVRTLVWAVLAVPAGLGLLTALFSSEGRGLHDRSAGTRVVRASA